MRVFDKIIHWILYSWLTNLFAWLLIGYIVVVVLIVVFIFIIASPEKAIAFITSIATITLAFAAFWTIRQNYKFREKDRKIQRIDKIQEWLLEICNIASSGSPKGDEQERRLRKWQTEKTLFLVNPIKIDAIKLDKEIQGEYKLESIIDELSKILEKHRTRPEELSTGIQSGESIQENVKRLTDKAFLLIAKIRDRL